MASTPPGEKSPTSPLIPAQRFYGSASAHRKNHSQTLLPPSAKRRKSLLGSNHTNGRSSIDNLMLSRTLTAASPAASGAAAAAAAFPSPSSFMAAAASHRPPNLNGRDVYGRASASSHGIAASSERRRQTDAETRYSNGHSNGHGSHRVGSASGREGDHPTSNSQGWMTAAEAQRRAASTDVLKRAAVPRSAAPAQLILEVSSTDESDDDEAADFLLGEHAASSDEDGGVDSSVRNSLASSSTVSGTSREAGLAATGIRAGAVGARQGASPSSRKKDSAKPEQGSSGDAQVKAPLPDVDAASSHWRWEGTPAERPQHGRTPEERSVLKRNEGTFYNAIRMDQEDILLHVNDCLLLRSDESPAPYIARALRFFADQAARGGEAKLVTVAWYLRPEETRDGRQPEHGQDEVLPSARQAQVCTFSVDCIEAPCTVLSYGSYCRHRAEVKRRRVLGLPHAPKWPVFFSRKPLKLQPPRRQVRATTASTSSREAPRFKRYDDKINHRNVKGETQLHRAAAKGDCELMQTLLDHGAYADISDFAGWTPLHEAAAEGFYTAGQLLITHGVNVNAVGPGGVTPLHDAAENGHAEVVTLLVRHGADVEAKNEQGKTAQDLASTKQVLEALQTTRRARRAATNGLKAIMQAQAASGFL